MPLPHIVSLVLSLVRPRPSYAVVGTDVFSVSPRDRGHRICPSGATGRDAKSGTRLPALGFCTALWTYGLSCRRGKGQGPLGRGAKFHTSPKRWRDAATLPQTCGNTRSTYSKARQVGRYDREQALRPHNVRALVRVNALVSRRLALVERHVAHLRRHGPSPGELLAKLAHFGGPCVHPRGSASQAARSTRRRRARLR